MSKFKVWYIPQVPMKPFEVEVEDLKTARLIEQTLVDFSLFEYENRVKPDYADAGGVAVFFEGEWCDVDDDDEEWWVS